MKILQSGVEMCDVEVADSLMARFKGLMLKKKLEDTSGLLIKRCSSIHTCFMRFPIDVIYLDKEYTVLYTETVVPWRVGKLVKRAKHVLELPKGKKESYTTGEKLELVVE